MYSSFRSEKCVSRLTASRRRFYNKLGLRHEETCQSARSRQHRSRIVEKQIDFFLLIVSIGQSLAAKSSQLGRPGAHRAAKSSQPGQQGQPDRAKRGQIEPARAPGAARASQSRPNRASKGAQVALGAPRLRRLGAQLPARVPGPQRVEQFHYGYGS